MAFTVTDSGHTAGLCVQMRPDVSVGPAFLSSRHEAFYSAAMPDRELNPQVQSSPLGSEPVTQEKQTARSLTL